MTQIVVNGNAYSDDGSAANDMRQGGHRTHLLPMIGDAMVRLDVVEDLVASAVSAPGTSATSTTSLAIGTGVKALTIQTGKSIVPGMMVMIANTADPTKWMFGVVTAYDTGTGALSVTVTAIAGSGTLAAWTVSLSGPMGMTGRQSLWIPAASMLPQFTNGPSIGTYELGSNKIMARTLDFDATTDENAQFQIRMPKAWDEGTLAAQFIWSHPSTATNFDVTWGIRAVAGSDGDAIDVAFGTAQTVTDSGGLTDRWYQSAETAAMTVGGSPVELDVVTLKVYRSAGSGSDTLAVDARLHGVVLFLVENAGNDA